MAEEKVIKTKYTYAVGRRKTAVAQVKLLSGSGKIEINGKEIKESIFLTLPLQLTDNISKYDIHAKVSGGGIVSQKEAVRLGISRGLVKINAKFRTSLKKSGLLTRDPREKERKKYGLKRARKAPQWSKR